MIFCLLRFLGLGVGGLGGDMVSAWGFCAPLVASGGSRRPRCRVVCAYSSSATVVEYGCAILRERDPVQKKELTHEARRQFAAGVLPIGTVESVPLEWGRQERPVILLADRMPKLKEIDVPPAIFYLHALAHVELSAINLCWDTLVQFAGRTTMPFEYYDELLLVADDESR